MAGLADANLIVSNHILQIACSSDGLFPNFWLQKKAFGNIFCNHWACSGVIATSLLALVLIFAPLISSKYSCVIGHIDVSQPLHALPFQMLLPTFGWNQMFLSVKRKSCGEICHEGLQSAMCLNKMNFYWITEPNLITFYTKMFINANSFFICLLFVLFWTFIIQLIQLNKCIIQSILVHNEKITHSKSRFKRHFRQLTMQICKSISNVLLTLLRSLMSVHASRNIQGNISLNLLYIYVPGLPNGLLVYTIRVLI